MTSEKMNEVTAAALREPFPEATIGKLPRVTCKDCSNRHCDRHRKSRCTTCGNYISESHVHLDFVGHAAVTDRLLSVDPMWTWEPMALDDRGLPLVDVSGGEARMWIRLTVCGVTRLGVGTAPANSFEIDKQLISDAIRNAAMRFGVALDLWSKEDLRAEDYDSDTGTSSASSSPSHSDTPDAAAGPTRSEAKEVVLEVCGGDTTLAAQGWAEVGKDGWTAGYSLDQLRTAMEGWVNQPVAPAEPEPGEPESTA